jgi:amino acid permease
MLSQLNTMALLGREASAISLLVMLFVLIQCLVAAQEHEEHAEYAAADDDPTVLRKFAALGSIGFAVGSQKLFLNIRHEMNDKQQAPRTLAMSLTVYGIAYVSVVVLAGPDPPSFLFDAIPEGTGRRLAGLWLWIHVAVSYAINSQALCSSGDRLLFRDMWPDRPRQRWILLTASLATLSYLVANAVPFFKDLVALIGALTSVPLTLTLPALLYRKAQQWSVVCPSPAMSIGSYSLFLYSLVFLTIGLLGAVSSIDRDWMSHGRPFSCH